MKTTESSFDEIIAQCKTIFEKKNMDYGSSWRIMRASSLTDQIFIKAKRIKTIENIGAQKVSDNIEDELKGIINYCILAIIQIQNNDNQDLNWTIKKTLEKYQKIVIEIKELMRNKNHDYGEAWRDMRPSSFTDLILSKLLRLKQIEDNDGKTLVSEGAIANYMDIVNYSIFALIKISQTSDK